MPGARIASQGTVQRQTARDSVVNRWTLSSAGAAFLILMPVASVLLIALSAKEPVWGHLANTVLPDALASTLILMTGAALLAALIGTLAAWLVTMYRFPGRDAADKLLVLPLAIPVYIAAYAYTDLLDYAGPIQSGLRAAFAWKSAGDYVFPDIRSTGGAVWIFALSLYPYVYLSARASFEQQSVCALEVARTLGCSPLETFWRVALPMARPAIAAGVSLVLMEALNDLGAVQYLGVETLSASIYATWMQRSNLAGAAQLAIVMLLMIAVLLVAERWARSLGLSQPPAGRYRPITFQDLSGIRGALALLAAVTPFLFGFAVPFLVLARHFIRHAGVTDFAGYFSAAMNSVLLALWVSAATLAIALTLAYALRFDRKSIAKPFVAVAGLGYAVPGTVLAVGLLSPLASFDNGIDAAMRGSLGISTGLLLSGSLFAVTLALVIRFLTIALGQVNAGLSGVSANIDAAAKTLGTASSGELFRLHLPALKPALGAAVLLVFVDTIKELPATLLLRPFNFETLATRIYSLTATEQFEEAAVGAVAIVVIGLLPVLFLHQTLRRGGS